MGEFFFIPLILFYQEIELTKNVVSNLILVPIGFTFLIFASYIINDLFDLTDDIKHPIKKFRPIPEIWYTAAFMYHLVRILCKLYSILLTILV